MEAKIAVVALSWQDGANIIVGQSHFIKTAEDLAEIMNASVPGVRYGLAFCEASGPCLVRTEGNDELLVADAVRCAMDVGAGHTFYLVMKNAFPINVLNQVKAARRCATSTARQRTRSRSWSAPPIRAGASSASSTAPPRRAWRGKRTRLTAGRCCARSGTSSSASASCHRHAGVHPGVPGGWIAASTSS
jgi:hypothetical protein